MPQLPRRPKSQFEISTGKELEHNRAEDVRRDDNVKDFTVKLEDIDTAVIMHLQNTVVPVVEDNGESYKIPIIYGSPERWSSVRRDGYYKDKDGKIQLPLIMIRRTGVTKNRTLSNKVDANHPQVYQTFTKQWSRKNAYNQFNLLNNISPVLEQYNVVVPDYVDVVYECIIWTDFMQQMNNIVEAINYAEGSYWGSPESYKFRVRIDDFSNTVDLPADNDRMVRTSFNINLSGYIITDSLNAAIAKTRKAHTNVTIRFGQEIQGKMENYDIPGNTISGSSAR